MMIASFDRWSTVEQPIFRRYVIYIWQPKMEIIREKDGKDISRLEALLNQSNDKFVS